jgi:hypothetical protein
MAKLYTVETFSTYEGIALAEDNDGRYGISLFKDKEANLDKLIYLDTKNMPEIFQRQLGMLFQQRVLDGVFSGKLGSSLILSNSKSGDNTKIIFSSYKNFKIKKGKAEYLFTPNKKHDYVLIKVSGQFLLELSGENGLKKFISFNNLQ